MVFRPSLQQAEARPPGASATLSHASSQRVLFLVFISVPGGWGGKRVSNWKHLPYQPPQLQSPAVFCFSAPFFTFSPHEDDNHDLPSHPASDAWYRSVEKPARPTTNVSGHYRAASSRASDPLFPISNTPAAGSSARPERTSTTSWRVMTTACWSLALLHSRPRSRRVDYARRLKVVREQLGHAGDRDARVLRKARTTVGWKGLINDPYLDETYASTKACALRASCSSTSTAWACPAGSEFLDVISPQYIGDLIAWGAIGARTTESQVHRELAWGLSAPSASRTARTATSASPPTPSSRPAAATTSCRCTRTASGHRAPAATRIAT